ncbi:MAG: hypothetical protein RLZ56_598 [Bacteroidota bacterium]|jgi:uncharacterized protein YyaL (SSP411 family)
MNAAPRFTNDLIHETSPYLLQHAHNPVQWIPWSAQVFEKAKQLNRPILLSIGYAACHWCHVMERESFESEEVAAYMNAHFVNVKVDREERPDVDHLYMDALQAMTGSGGWPLNIFLLSDGKPFYGGTYFPPIPMHNRASWMDVLKGVKEAYENNLEKLTEQGNQLTKHLVQTNIGKPLDVSPNDAIATKEEIEIIAHRIMQSADKDWGGFGNAPKFPQTFALQVLLRHYHFFGEESSLNHVRLTLDKMIQGGIYDHIGGGFSRYSTDAQWQAPHFEKMLYDNALLLSVLSEAYQITKQDSYKIVMEQTIHFLNTILSNGEGVFYAALDADSEGVEGKFYTWKYEELKQLLPVNLINDFCNYYQVSEAGNWEHTNILWTQQDFMQSETKAFVNAKNILHQARMQRIPPALDHKIILSWNNLMVVALCKSYAALGVETYQQQAIQAMHWIESNMFNATENYFYHSCTNGQAKNFAFLEDYATIIQAYIHLQEITGESSYLYKAKAWTEYVIAHFSDEENLLFYFTPNYQKDVLVRKKETYDGAQPSGNALMSYQLLYLGSQFSNSAWTERGRQMVGAMRKILLQHPSSFSIWAQSFMVIAMDFTVLLGVGSEVKKAIPLVNKHFIPLKMQVFIPKTDPALTWTKGKELFENQYFICKYGVCAAPIAQLSDYLANI